ncbi:hypothetical protein [Corallincola spongiicola]|uniref:Uncharacterized protein n=1 Tax=Corallincola spongiicola TaxID=2520508 RepID=A0ABY1WSK1_9GAMM|nr:hypothetical protein [Corallincola spongiicola]TAA47600.1 hypothetical protein EXY25_10325 [Corallincola spongiicola]
MGILFNPRSDERTLVFRGIMLVGWYCVIFLASNALLIGIVSGYAGFELAMSGVTDLERAFAEGYRARVRFFRSYDDYIAYGQFIILVALALSGKLPWTTKK